MKSFITYKHLTLALLTTLLFSCQKDEFLDTPQAKTPETPVTEATQQDILPQIKLGKKLENPYSVANMKKAYKSLKAKRALVAASSSSSVVALSTEQDVEIETTDYYVKFWIETDEQKNMLIADSLNLSDIPLDVEVLEEGIQFIDEDAEKQEAHWVYTAVTKDYTFRPEITYEILEDLFLIEPSTVEGQEEEAEETQQGSGQITTNAVKQNDFLLDLEEEALRITDNLDPQNAKAATADDGITSLWFWRRKSKATPQGYVRVYNTVTRKLEPVVGIKVKTRRWFKWAKGWTNSRGFYRVNRGYRNNVRYTAVFKNTRGFKIWPSFFSISSARYRAGRHSKNGHNFNFYTNSVGWRWATVNNATVKYWDYCTQFGVDKPNYGLRIVANSNGYRGTSAAPMLRKTWGWAGFRTNSDLISFLGKMSISVPANALWIVLRFILPDVIINANASKGTDGVTYLTFHELAHASHFKKVRSNYWIKYINYIITYGAYGDGSGKNAGICALGEAWAYHFGYFLTIQEFGNNNRQLTLNAFENFDPLQRPQGDGIDRFTTSWRGWIPSGIMYDLMDTNTDLVRTGYVDNASGYSIRSIYGALDYGIESPQAFRDRLLEENGNRDEDDVRELFEAYYWD